MSEKGGPLKRGIEDNGCGRVFDPESGIMLIADFDPEHTRIEAIRVCPVGGMSVTLGTDVVDSLRDMFGQELR